MVAHACHWLYLGFKMDQQNLELQNIFRIIFIFLLPLINLDTFCLFFDLKIFYEAKWSFVWIFEFAQSGDFKILEKKILNF